MRRPKLAVLLVLASVAGCETEPPSAPMPDARFALYPNPQIVLTGVEYSAISPGFEGDCFWGIVGSAIAIAWDRDWCEDVWGISPWVEYTATLGPGTWRIGLNAINHIVPGGPNGLGTDPSWYPQFEVGSNLTTDVIAIPASDTEVNHGDFEYEVPTHGPYTVRYWWLNDQTGPGLDANIKIVSAFFDRVVKFVLIDIKPGSDPNSINCRKEKIVIPVAILTTDQFDATTVDHTTVAFEAASEFHSTPQGVQRHEQDVDGDGDIDLLFHFRLGDTSLDCASTEGTLTGETFDGQAVEGTDAVRMIGG